MNRLSIFFVALLAFGLTACQTEPDATGTTEQTTIVEDERMMVVADVDSQLADIDRDLQDLETRAASAPEEVREEIAGELTTAREERQEIDQLRASLNQTQDYDEYRETQREIWDDVRELDARVTEARFEAIEERQEFVNVAGEEVEEIDNEITRLEARSSTLDESARAEYDEQIANLRQQREAFNQNWEQVEASTEENWRDLRGSFAEGWRDLRRSFYDIRLPDVDVDVNTQTEPAGEAM